MTHDNSCTCNECLPFDMEVTFVEDYSAEWEEAFIIADSKLRG